VVNLAIVGTGGMAHAHAKAYSTMPDVKLVAACDILPDRVKEFAKEFSIKNVYTDVDLLLAQKGIDAVDVVTPDSSHASVSLKVIARGKHVLCEKPLATNYPDAQAMADAAANAGVINMVNLSYRNSSAIQKAHEMVQQGKLGKIMHVEASYLQSWLASKVWGDWRTSPSMLWRLSTRHGSAGTLGDIGVHILDFTTFAAGDIKSLNCRLKSFPKAEGDRIGEYVLDTNDSMVVTIEMAGGALGTVHASRWAVGQANSLSLRVYGDKGSLVVNLDQSYTTMQVCLGEDVDKVAWKTLDCGQTPDIYHRFIASIQTGKNDQPDFAVGARVQKMLDACIESDREGKTITI
jgi:predicted dehydrogenase